MSLLHYHSTHLKWMRQALVDGEGQNVQSGILSGSMLTLRRVQDILHVPLHNSSRNAVHQPGLHGMTHPDSPRSLGPPMSALMSKVSDALISCAYALSRT